MFNRSKNRIAIALITAAAISTASVPASARSAAYCRDMVSSMSDDGGFNPLLLIPLAAVGAGVGALVGVAASGIAVSTGAIVGTGTGAGFGLFHGLSHRHHHDMQAAYEECRAQ